MALKNLFTYATKELSQDAFLCWLIDNYDDPVIGNVSCAFINHLTGFKIDFSKNKICKLTCKLQHRKIDIVVDFWLNEESDSNHYVFVIEDKTFSSIHNSQLKRYSAIVNTWNKNEIGYQNRTVKIFYKVDLCSEDEKRDPSLKSGEWKSFFIDDIHNFFEDYNNINSEIFKDYVKHISSIYNKIHDVKSLTNIAQCDLLEARTFFCNALFPNQKEGDIKNSFYYETGTYQGRYFALRAYYVLNNDKYRDTKCPIEDKTNKKYFNYCYPLVEFIFRKDSEDIIIYTHITFKYYDPNTHKREWTWKKSNDNIDKEAALNVTNALKEKLSNIGFKCAKMNGKSCQTISVGKIKKSDIANKEALIKIFKKYVEVFKALE